ncbi:MAG: hypothetical protein U0992_05480 [Planctomycetaceae bacterium]
MERKTCLAGLLGCMSCFVIQNDLPVRLRRRHDLSLMLIFWFLNLARSTISDDHGHDFMN